MNSDKYYIYTDGSSDPKKKTGGWAFCVAEETDSKEAIHTAHGFGGDGTTNNRMELTAVINALHYAYVNLKSLKHLIIYTDSQYVSNAIYFGWLTDWRNNGWTNSNGKPTKNPDLWEDMYKILKKYRFRKVEVDIMWVRGHSGHEMNELADKLANSGRKTRIIHEHYD